MNFDEGKKDSEKKCPSEGENSCKSEPADEGECGCKSELADEGKSSCENEPADEGENSCESEPTDEGEDGCESECGDEEICSYIDGYDDDEYDELIDAETYKNHFEDLRNVNYELLDLFEEDLKKRGLSENTIDSHLKNVNFYINTYLLRERRLTMEYGISKIGDFLGEFFIRRCIWSTPKTIRSTATSIKKFYRCLTEHGKLPQIDYDFLVSEIKNGLVYWQDLCAEYNDPNSTNPFLPF